MNLDEIRSILQLMEANKLVEFEYEDDGRRLKLRRAEDRVVTTAVPVAVPAAVPMATHQRGSWVASSLVTKSKTTAHNTKSGIVVVSSCMAAMYSPQVAALSAAST